MPISHPLNYISKVAAKANIKGETLGFAVKILHEARRRRFTAGKDPMGLAAAVLYIACIQNKMNRTQKEIAEAAGVTEVTIRNRYKTLRKQLGISLPD